MNEDLGLAERMSFSLDARGFIAGLLIWLISGLAVGFVIGTIFGLIIGLLVTLVNGLKPTRDILKRQKSGSGLRDSVINASFFAIGICEIFVLLFSLVFGLRLGLIFGVLCGWVFMIMNNYGFTRYFIICYLLAYEGSIPPIHLSFTGGYDLFLDHAADIGLLRKVGGGYIFRHRMLMDYLAEQYEKTQVKS
jgi:hypothetical protein